MSGYLGEFEQMVLLATMRLGDEAYGLRIGDEIESVAQRRPSSGSLYTTLERLERKGYLSSTLEPTAVAGRAGRPRRYYSLTPTAMTALRRSRHALKRFWAGHAQLLDESP